MRLMTLHFSQMGLTEGLTFIGNTSFSSALRYLLGTPSDSALCQIVGRHLDCNMVTGDDSDIVRSQLAGNMRKDYMTVAQFNLEHCIRQGINDHALYFNYILFRHRR